MNHGNQMGAGSASPSQAGVAGSSARPQMGGMSGANDGDGDNNGDNDSGKAVRPS
jgi:hypothetical protein